LYNAHEMVVRPEPDFLAVRNRVKQQGKKKKNRQLGFLKDPLKQGRKQKKCGAATPMNGARCFMQNTGASL